MPWIDQLASCHSPGALSNRFTDRLPSAALWHGGFPEALQGRGCALGRRSFGACAITYGRSTAILPVLFDLPSCV